MLSILLQARSFDPTPYKVGDKILFPMATGKKVEEQTLIYRGKETFKAENGVKYRCLVFSLVEYDKKKKEKEVITFYVTDDKNATVKDGILADVAPSILKIMGLEAPADMTGTSLI